MGHAGRSNSAKASAAGPTPVSCHARKLAVGQGRFGPSGGTLVVGSTRLFIPGGALRDTVTITATAPGDTTSTVEFEPHGLHFAKPVGLAIGSEGCAIPEDARPSVVYLDANGRVLEIIWAEYDPRFKAVTAPIEHFSGYAIAF